MIANLPLLIQAAIVGLPTLIILILSCFIGYWSGHDGALRNNAINRQDVATQKGKQHRIQAAWAVLVITGMLYVQWMMLLLHETTAWSLWTAVVFVGLASVIVAHIFGYQRTVTGIKKHAARSPRSESSGAVTTSE